MRIQVTAEDIKNGYPNNTSYCPIALACKRVFPDFNPSVTLSYIRLTYLKREMRQAAYKSGQSIFKFTTIPSQAVEFIRAFDNKMPVAPFEFEVEPKNSECD